MKMRSNLLPKTLLGSALAFAMMLTLLPTATHAQSIWGECEEEPDQNTKLMNYSLYWESFKNEDYETSMPYLRWMIRCAPTTPRSDDRNFERLRKGYEALGLASEDPSVKRAYLDSSLIVFDTTVEILQGLDTEVDEYEWTFEKGRFILKHIEDLKDREQEAYDAFMKNYDMDAERLQPYYYNIIIGAYVKNEDKQGAIDFMDEIEQNYGTKPEFSEVMGYVTQVRNVLFSSPEERMEFLESRLDADPENVEFMTELFDIYTDLGEREKMFAMGERLMEMEPSATTYSLIAKLRQEDGELEESLTLYQQALDLLGEEGDAATKRDIYFNMGRAYAEQEQLSRARTFYRNALQLDNNFSPALIGIGDLYVTAVSNCGTLEREDRAVYWLVVDYYERARARAEADRDKTAASRKIQNIRPYFPDAEALFFKNWKAGDSYRIDYGCYTWVNENTKVRNP